MPKQTKQDSLFLADSLLLCSFDLRIKQFQSQLTPNQVVVVSQPHDIRYFTGFISLLPEEREAFLVLSSNRATLHHASFTPYKVPQALSKWPSFSVKKTVRLSEVSQTVAEHTQNTQHSTIEEFSRAWSRVNSEITQAQNVSATQTSQVLIDSENMVVNEYEYLKNSLTQCLLSNLDRDLIWNVRMIKDEIELEVMRAAGRIGAAALTQVVGAKGEHLKEGISEHELASQLDAAVRTIGADGPAFPTIVAFGANSALPHHQPSSAKLEKNQAVLIDFGASVAGYRSDMTRSFWFGSNPSPDFLQIQAIVQHAYQVSLDKASSHFNQTSKPKNASQTTLHAYELDIAAREVITKAGFGNEFIHTTGHGLGLEIHEQPSLSSHATTILQPNMVITIEPGIYLEGKCGYRYENSLIITNTTLENSTLTNGF